MDNTSTRAASRKTRVYVFREFLLQTYSHLQPGDIVLDVAGGAGNLSWLLKNVDGIQSVVLDPTRIKTQRMGKSVEYLRNNPDKLRERSVPHLPSYQPLASLVHKLEGKKEFESPSHLRLLVDADLVIAVSEFRRTGNLEGWMSYFARATEKGRETQTLGYSEGEEVAKGDIIDAKSAIEIILKAKLVVGFHPDQATDYIIELAEELVIPCCVVPCCVFPSEFPNRQLSDGSQVRCYSELLIYLKEKSKKLQTAKLDFHFTETAKNVALYC